MDNQLNAITVKQFQMKSNDAGRETMAKVVKMAEIRKMQRAERIGGLFTTATHKSGWVAGRSVTGCSISAHFSVSIATASLPSFRDPQHSQTMSGFFGIFWDSSDIQ